LPRFALRSRSAIVARNSRAISTCAISASRARARWGMPAYPPNPIRRREATITVAAPVIVPGAEPTDEGCPVLLVQGTTASITGRTAKPRSLPLLTSKGPFLLELNDLYPTIDGNGHLSSAETTDP
jgi:hypothetical protein